MTAEAPILNPMFVMVNRASDPNLTHKEYINLLRAIAATASPKDRRMYLTAAVVERREARKQ